jgi:hypothetical protein
MSVAVSFWWGIWWVAGFPVTVVLFLKGLQAIQMTELLTRCEEIDQTPCIAYII